MCVTNVLPLLFLRTAKSCIFVKGLLGILLSDLHQLTARKGVVLAVVRTERVDTHTHIHVNKAVTVAGLH